MSENLLEMSLTLGKDEWRQQIQEISKRQKLIENEIRCIESTRRFRNTTTAHSLKKYEADIEATKLKIEQHQWYLSEDADNHAKSCLEKAVEIDSVCRRYWFIFKNRADFAKAMPQVLNHWDDYRFYAKDFQNAKVPYYMALIALAPEEEAKEFISTQYDLRDALRAEASRIGQGKQSAEAIIQQAERKLEKIIAYKERIEFELSDAGLKHLEALYARRQLLKIERKMCSAVRASRKDLQIPDSQEDTVSDTIE